MLSAFEFRIADKLGDAAAVLFHFSIFWIFPIVLLYMPIDALSIMAIVIALFYVYVLAGDILLSVFGVGFVFLLFTMLISLYIDIQRKKKYDQ